MSEAAKADHDPYRFTVSDPDADFSTQIIHHGESPFASAFPVYQSNTVDGVYMRLRNPTLEALEEKMRHLEGGAGCVAMASGMAAVSHTLLGLLKAGDRIVAHHRMFIGVETLLSDFVAALHIEVVRVDLNSSSQLSQALQQPTRLVYFEVLTNPSLEVVDAPTVIASAHGAGALVVIDNTLLTPYLLRPIVLGADVVLHSATKYLAGHGDVLAGFATFKDPAIAHKVHKARRIIGGLLSPSSANLVMRGIKTLPLRMERHCRNALQVAEFLRAHQVVKQLNYPGLRASADHARASQFLKLFGGLISFEPHAHFDWQRFVARLRFCKAGMSFGEPGTRVQREGLIRVSVGLEDPNDIISDLQRALASGDTRQPPSV